jgi:hypothetical protein
LIEKKYEKWVERVEHDTGKMMLIEEEAKSVVVVRWVEWPDGDGK